MTDNDSGETESANLFPFTPPNSYAEGGIFVKEQFSESDMLNHLEGILWDPVTPQNGLQDVVSTVPSSKVISEPYNIERVDQILEQILKQLNEYTPKSKMVNVRAACIADELVDEEQEGPELLIEDILDTTALPTSTTGNVRAYTIASSMRCDVTPDPQITNPEDLPSVANSTRSLHYVDANKDYLVYEGHDIEQVSDHVTEDVIQCAIDVCYMLQACQMSSNKILHSNINNQYSVNKTINKPVYTGIYHQLSNKPTKGILKLVEQTETSITSDKTHYNTNLTNSSNTAVDTNANLSATNKLLESRDKIDNWSQHPVICNRVYNCNPVVYTVDNPLEINVCTNNVTCVDNRFINTCAKSSVSVKFPTGASNTPLTITSNNRQVGGCLVDWVQCGE